MAKIYSSSQINTFLLCGYKYKLRYIDKIKIDVVSPYLERGVRVHEKLANNDFHSEDAEDSRLLSNAASLLLKLNDRYDILSGSENELKLFGSVSGERFIGILDKVWPKEGILLDWKTGTLKKDDWLKDYIIQAYIYNELFNQLYGSYPTHVYVAFLGSGDLWVPTIANYQIGTDGFRCWCETLISSAIFDIKRNIYEKNYSKLCNWCDFKKICSGD